MGSQLSAEVASTAARLIVEEGMEYGPAKRRAAKLLGRGSVRSVDLPGNDEVEDEVRSYIELFCADTQPGELLALRKVALLWMERLQDMRPYLTGAVWRGTATRLSSVHLQLYCDDSKQAELTLIDKRVDYDVGTIGGPRGEPIDVLTVSTMSPELGEAVTVHMSILDHDDVRGALKSDARGQSERGDLAALRRLLEASAP
ncbi:hypothetical protein [Piscinibacter gummiphilus]|uniref:Nucleotidyltransferase n=1 Tax=Piscinibacter gummiphilus TaxID=946333 RepID=A0ABZ0CSG1_9BURK|nr:hypothetical protein [Piscinibacter gummiphilus]WOB07446.1 hypothetical protein RXV79_21345 [Piscinibacter gummiphilus]